MTSSSIFSSSSSEQRWVHQISKTFGKDLAITIDTPICVFQVPQTTSATKPEAYAPQQIGLGPYHHLRPDLYKMERHKLDSLKRVLKPEQILNFQQLVINKLMDQEPSIRACYDKYLDLDGDTLAWILAIDGVFLLDFLGTSANPNKRKLVQDIMMLENQIPVILLSEIQDALQLSFAKNKTRDPLLSSWDDDEDNNDENDALDSNDDDDDDDDEDSNNDVLMPYSNDPKAVVFAMLLRFLEPRSPLNLTEQFEFRLDLSRVHLLDYMYHLIVNNRGVQATPMFHTMGCAMLGNVEGIVDAAAGLGIGRAQGIQKAIKFIKNVPWDKILALVGQFKKSDNKSKPAVEEITIPSVSNLGKIAGVKFTRTRGGIRDIQFKEEERTLYLPVIKLNVDSEVILRNLVSYEAASAKPGSVLELAEYVDLMCGIVGTAEDVGLLREKNIIEGDLKNDEIADLFNGISKSTGRPKEKSNVEDAVGKVNELFDNKPLVKACRFIKKRVYASWKILTLLSSILLLLLLILQAFCQVYGCSTHFFKSSRQGLRFADVSSLVL